MNERDAELFTGDFSPHILVIFELRLFLIFMYYQLLGNTRALEKLCKSKNLNVSMSVLNSMEIHDTYLDSENRC